jgi:hypothetical protein
VRWYAFPASGQPHDAWTRHDIPNVSGRAYEGMAVADLSGDGRGDIILSIGKRVEWLENPGGAGTGNWAVHPIASGTAHELRLADIDGDGKRDVVTSRTRNIDFQNSARADSWTIRSWGGGAEGTSLDGMALLGIGAGKGRIKHRRRQCGRHLLVRESARDQRQRAH